MIAFLRVIAFCIVFSTAGANAIELDFAPLFETRADAILAPDGWRAAGPFFENAEYPDGRMTLAFPRPLFTRFEDKPELKIHHDVLWPFMVRRETPEFLRWRAVLAFYSAEAPGAEDEETAWGLFPVLFGGNTDRGSYFALFPVGGRIYDALTFDQIDFVLFPGYLHTRKDDTESHGVLWPVFSRTEKNGELLKWRVFPLYGVSRTESKEQRFFLWPFVHSVKMQKADKQAGGWFVLPLGGRFTERNDEGEVLAGSWAVLWPFFSGASGYGRRKLNLGWPFFQFDSQMQGGEVTKEKRYFWPLYGRRDSETSQSMFFLWPFWQTQDYKKGDTHTSNRYLLPFYWRFQHQSAGEPAREYQQFWPLYKFQSVGDASHLALLALWPGRLRISDPVQRNFAPLWTLYSRAQDADAVRHDALWGLIQAARSGERKTFHLFPVVDYAGDEDTWRLSFFKGLLTLGTQPEAKRRLLWLLPW